jgi:hypothetical protein
MKGMCEEIAIVYLRIPSRNSTSGAEKIRNNLSTISGYLPDRNYIDLTLFSDALSARITMSMGK